MQPVESFMKDYFQVRTECSRDRNDATRVLAFGYLAFDVVEEGDEETILRVQSSETAAEVITSYHFAKANRACRYRYQLISEGESWQIASIAVECFICDGTGIFKDSACEVCKGKGWRPLADD